MHKEWKALKIIRLEGQGARAGAAGLQGPMQDLRICGERNCLAGKGMGVGSPKAS